MEIWRMASPAMRWCFFGTLCATANVPMFVSRQSAERDSRKKPAEFLQDLQLKGT